LDCAKWIRNIFFKMCSEYTDDDLTMSWTVTWVRSCVLNYQIIWNLFIMSMVKPNLLKGLKNSLLLEVYKYLEEITNTMNFLSFSF